MSDFSDIWCLSSCNLYLFVSTPFPLVWKYHKTSLFPTSCKPQSLNKQVIDGKSSLLCAALTQSYGNLPSYCCSAHNNNNSTTTITVALRYIHLPPYTNWIHNNKQVKESQKINTYHVDKVSCIQHNTQNLIQIFAILNFCEEQKKAHECLEIAISTEASTKVDR